MMDEILSGRGSSAWWSAALVRQRSRVRTPAAALFPKSRKLKALLMKLEKDAV